MVRNVTLSLMIGPAVPIPVSRTVIDALQSVQVTTTAEIGKPSVFQLTFSISNRSPITTLFMLSGGGGIPLVRVDHHRDRQRHARRADRRRDDRTISNQPGTDGMPGTLTVTGEDLSRVMDYQLLPADGTPYPAMPPEARVLIMLAKYVLFGVIRW
jgi:hypothetical protein